MSDFFEALATHVEGLVSADDDFYLLLGRFPRTLQGPSSACSPFHITVVYLLKIANTGG